MAMEAGDAETMIQHGALLMPTGGRMVPALNDSEIVSV